LSFGFSQADAGEFRVSEQAEWNQPARRHVVAATRDESISQFQPDLVVTAPHHMIAEGPMIRSFLVGTGVGFALGAVGASLVLGKDLQDTVVPGGQGRRLRILILGGGFAGYYALRGLEKRLGRTHECEITLINRENYMLFTSMLHEVAASDLDASDIVNPLHRLVRRAGFFSGEVQDLDLEHKTVLVSPGGNGETRRFAYDYLVVGLGSASNFYDLPGIEENSTTMKCLEDAAFLRNHMISRLEEADFNRGQGNPAALTFVVCGGGFSGVETIGAMTDFLRDATEFYPNLHRDMIKLLLVHAGPQLLPELGGGLGAYAAEKLRERGVEVVLNTPVRAFKNGAVQIGSGDNVRSIPTSTVVWTAGVKPANAVQDLAAKKVKGRLLTLPTLELPEWPGVYAVGDCAAIPDPHHPGKFYGPTAQNAVRQGELVAENIVAAILGRKQREFRYREMGQLAAIGQRRGIANILGFRFSGFPAWWLWRTVYLYKLPGLQKKVRVAIDWTLDAIFGKDLVQFRTSRIVSLQRRLELSQRTPTNETTEPAA
jgi:NADH:ubiquinone reductase (H+-translocating)